LNVVHLSVPPLRKRPDDIIPLAQELLLKFCGTTELPEKTIAEEAYHALLSYSFPGNVRQLQNCVERAAVFSGLEKEIRVNHLPEEIRRQQNIFQTPESVSANSQAIPDEGIDFSRFVSGIERDLLLKTLDKTGGNKMQAAKLLNLKRTTLVEKIKRLNIEVADDGPDEAAA
jgi:DNA-binding NtrC family response regulator